MAKSYTTRKQREERARVNREKRARGERVISATGRDITKPRVARGGHTTAILTPALVEGMTQLCAKGNFPHHSAMALGVKEATFRTWWDQGKKGIEPYASMYLSMESARQQAITAAVSRIKLAGEKGIWQADARYLESAASNDWMRTEKRVSEGGDAFKSLLDELRDMRSKSSPVPVSPEAPPVAPTVPDSGQPKPQRTNLN